MQKIFHTIFFITIFCMVDNCCHAQTTYVDSLKKNIATAAAPADKLQALLAFCDAWESFNADTLKPYALQTKQIATQLQNKQAILQGDYYLAAWLFQKDRVDTALAAINTVIANVTNTIPYGSFYVKMYGLRANILMRTLHYDEVLKQDLALLPIAEQHNDTVGLIRFTTGIGNVNLRLKKTSEALQWHYKALGYMQTDALKAKCSFVYTNIAVVYYHLSVTQDTKPIEDSIETNIQKAIQYSRVGNSLTNLANGLSMYGNVLAEYKKIAPAETALKEALETRKKIGDVFYVISDMIALSALYENSNNSAKAIETCLQALDLAKKNGNDFSSTLTVYSSLGELYSNAGDYKKYSEALEKKIALQDSIYKQNSAEAVAELEEKYEVQKKETTIIQQKYNLAKQRNVIYAIVAVLLVVIVIVVAILRSRKQQQNLKLKEIMLENEKATVLAVNQAKEEERQRIIADLHDDVGGGLSTIRMVSDLIAEQKEQTLQLEQYAVKISGIARDVTQRMNTVVWALNMENDTLQNLSEYIREYGYAFFENSAIEFKSNLPETTGAIKLSGLQRKNLFLCVKEALNNAYKHSGAKHVWVTITFLNSILTVSVQDDGKGIIQENAFGNGLKNMRKRMMEINGSLIFEKAEGTKIQLEVILGLDKE